ncbi:AMP-binding protein [Nonomuraea sp. NPDC050783]|uniref:AMP-binding protein n=1 Tax=Nonomuraea sp. NPDC050783 TaxID=3154634 RepID=UPI00346686D7
MHDVPTWVAKHQETRSVTDLLQQAPEVVSEAVDDWALREPGRRMLYDGARRRWWTYGQVVAATDAIAANLQGHGVRPGDRVATYLRDPLPGVLWMYASWRLGAVFSPLNDGYDGEILTYLIDDTAPAVILTEQKQLARLLPAIEASPLSPLVVSTDDDAAPLPEGVLREPEFHVACTWERPAVGFADPACVIYTSGTTGPAKGVIISHRWMAQYTWLARQLTTPDDVVYSDLPLYHVGGAVFCIARASWSGAGVGLWDKFSTSRFWERIDEVGATMATLMDVMTPWLMNAPEGPDDTRNTLKLVTMQPLPSNHREIAQRFGIDFVLAGFGQTESGHVLAALLEECPPGTGTPDELYRGLSHEEISARVLSAGGCFMDGANVNKKGFMGRPNPWYEVAVLDDDGTPLPAGVTGELGLRPKAPALLSLGYLNKPEATAGAWRDLWFHTGDAVLADDDGFLYFVERMGSRIRRRGENVTAYFVEELIRRHPAVDMAAAFGVPSAEGDEDDIVVAVTVVAGAALEPPALLAWAENELPRFMCPQHVIVVPAIPTTPTGKIQKFRLREDFLHARDASTKGPR